MEQIVRWTVETTGGATLSFTTIGVADTNAAVDKWIGHGHHVNADWRYETEVK